MITEIKWAKTIDDLKAANKWSKVADLMSVEGLKTHQEYIFEGDEAAIYSFNKAQADKMSTKMSKRKTGELVGNTALRTDVFPCPFSGNILGAKLVILSLNPGFIKDINDLLPTMLDEETAAQYVEDEQKALRMESESLYKFPIDQMVGDYYWARALRDLSDEVYGDTDLLLSNGKNHSIFRDVALLELYGYHSESWSGKPSKDLLESQKFTLMLIDYLVKNYNTQFLLLRAKDLWDDFFKHYDNYELLKVKLICKENSNRSQSISEENLGESTWKAIKKALE